MIRRRSAIAFAPFVLLATGLVHCSSGDPAAPPVTPDGGAPRESGAGTTDGAAPPACPAPTGSGTTHAANVEATETWTAAGSPHLVTDTVVVRNGATLTIEPCAEVRIAKDKSIAIATVPAATSGTLKAEGTKERPIRIGGIDGARWGALAVQVPSGKATLRYVTLEGGGGDLETLHASLFVRGPGEWPSRRDVLVDHVTIRGSLGYGAVVDRAGAFAEGSTDLVVTDAGRGDAERAFPLRIGEGAIHTLPSGTYTGNAIDEILIFEDAVVPGSGLREDATMRDLGVPYRIGQGTNKQMRVEDATLTIQPGATLRFEKGAGFEVHHQNEDADAKAALVAVGTAQHPIVFTSASAAPAAGDWVGLWFGGRPSAKNQLENVRIEYAGGDCLCGLATCNDIVEHDAALLMAHPPPSAFLKSSVIAKSAGHGVHRGWQSDSQPSFLPTNTFTDVAGCTETLPIPANGTCSSNPPCP